MSKTIVMVAIMLLSVTVMDHFSGNHTSYGLIDLNESGNFTNTTAGETIHLPDIQEDRIVVESGDDLRK